MTVEPESRVLELAGRLCDEQVTDEEFAELDALLASDAEAREAYRLYLDMHQHLAGTALESTEEAPKNVISLPVRPVWIWTGIAALVLAAVVVTRLLTPTAAPPVVDDPEPELETPDFVLTRAIDIEWEHKTRFQAQLGEPIKGGHLRLKSGIARPFREEQVAVSSRMILKIALTVPAAPFERIMPHAKHTAYIGHEPGLFFCLRAQPVIYRRHPEFAPAPIVKKSQKSKAV